MSHRINVDAVRVAVGQLTSHARDCPCAQNPVAQAAIDAHNRTVHAALNELERAQPVVAIFDGKTWTKRGDEMCVYATADDVKAIRHAVKG